MPVFRARGFVQTVITNPDGVKAAPQWTAQHSDFTGNPYLINSLVYDQGRVYQCIATNDSIPPQVGGNAYWADLGGGFLLPDENKNIKGGSINTSSSNGAAVVFDSRTKGQINLGDFGTMTSIVGTASSNRTIFLPNASGGLCMSSDERFTGYTLYISNVDLSRTASWTQALTIPTHLSASFGGATPSVVDSINIHITSRVGGGLLFAVPPEVRLEDTNGNAVISSTSIGTDPQINRYYRDANRITTGSGRTPYVLQNSPVSPVNGLNLKSGTLPTYLSSTLAVASTNAQTSFTLTGNNPFVSSAGINSNVIGNPLGNYVKINSEIVQVIAASGLNTIVVARGAFGTTPAAHAAGSVITTDLSSALPASAGGLLAAKICFIFQKLPNYSLSGDGSPPSPPV